MTATNTSMSFLMHKGSSETSYAKLIDILDYPDMFGTPDTLDTTTLSNTGYTHILGINSSDAMTFNAIYDPTDFQTLKALENQIEDYAVWFGADVSGTTITPKGDLGQISFKGMLSVAITGAGVNEVRKMAVTIAPSDDLAYAVAA